MFGKIIFGKVALGKIWVGGGNTVHIPSATAPFFRRLTLRPRLPNRRTMG